MKNTPQPSSTSSNVRDKAMAEDLPCRSLTQVVSLTWLSNAHFCFQVPMSSWSASRQAMKRCQLQLKILILRLGMSVATIRLWCLWEQKLTYAIKILRAPSPRTNFVSISSNRGIRHFSRPARRISRTETSEMPSTRSSTWLYWQNTPSFWKVLTDFNSPSATKTRICIWLLKNHPHSLKAN